MFQRFNLHYFLQDTSRRLMSYDAVTIIIISQLVYSTKAGVTLRLEDFERE